MTKGICLTDEELAAYQLGELSPGRADEADDHFTGCARCAAAVAALDGLTDGVIAALRQYPPSLPATRPGSTGPHAPGRPEAAAELPRLVAGYEVIEELGRGGMGVVYKARQVRLNRTVALKMVLSGAHAGSAELLRFLIEAEMVARLDHPHIVQVYEVGTHEGRPFIALEYVGGGTLADRLHGRPWAPREAAALVERVAWATDHAHRHGVVHRDLKPANVLLAADGSPKVADFGLAKLLEGGAGMTSTGAILGTPAYMAPEQAEGNGRQVGPRSDVFALGSILYELLAGHPPFAGDTPMEVLRGVIGSEPPALSRVRPGLARDLCTICQRCLEKDPRRRYASAAALAEDLGRYREGRPVRARRVGEVERAWKWARRRPAVAGLLLVVACSLVGWAGSSTYLAVVARDATERAEDDARRAARNARRADRAADEALEAKGIAERARQEAESREGRLTFQAGLAEAQAGRVDRGLHLLVRALGTAPEDAAFQRVVRANLAAYADRLPVARGACEGQGPPAWFLGPDGAAFATVTPENRLQRWDTRTLQKVGEPGPALGGEVRSLSGDGRWAVVARATGRERPLFLVDATRGTEGTPLGLRFEPWTYVGFGPGGVAWVRKGVENEGRVEDVCRLFGAGTGKPLGPAFAHDFRLFRCRDGRTVWMTFPHPNGERAEDRAAFKALPGEKESLTSWQPDPAGGDATVRFDGRALVTLGVDGLVRWWDPATGAQTRKPWRAPRTARKRPCALLPGGRTLLVTRTDGRLSWFDLPSGQEHPASLPVGQRVGVEVHPDGNTLLIGGAGQPPRVWRLDQLPPPVAPGEASAPFLDVAYGPGRDVICAATEGTTPGSFAALTDPAGRPIACLNSQAVWGAVFSPNGERLATHTPPGPLQPCVHLWDARTGQAIRRVALDKYVHALTFSPDGNTVAIGYVGGACLWDVRTGRVAPVVRQQAPVGRVLFSPDGKRLVTGSLRGWTDSAPGFRVWDAATGRPLGDEIPTADAPRFAFGPDGHVLVALELPGGKLSHWDVGETLTRRGDPVWLHRGTDASLAVFRADGARVLTGYPDGRVCEWDAESGAAVGGVLSHAAPVTALAYGPDGRTLAVGCEDGRVWLRDAATGLPLGPPTVHRGAVRGVAFAADGATFLSTAADGATLTRKVPVPLPQAPAVLDLWLRAASGTRLDGEGVVLLEAAAWQEARAQLAAAWPAAAADLTRPPASRDWYAERAAAAEADGVGYAWWLGRLIDSEGVVTGANWLTRARRADFALRENRPEEAARDYREVASVGGASLLAWYDRRAAEASHAGDRRLAGWYLDRLVAARPADGSLYARRAAVHALLGEKEEAQADRMQACRLGADHATILALADEFAGEGAWAKADEVLALDARHWGLSPPTLRRQTVVHLELGRTDRYRAGCAALVTGYARAQGGKPLTVTGADLAWLCTLGPGVPEKAEVLERWTRALEEELPALRQSLVARLGSDGLARQAFASARYRILCARGAVLLRAGKGPEALERLGQAADLDVDDLGWHRPLLALACGQLGKDEEARRWKGEARKWLDAHPAAGPEWVSRAGVALQRKEAGE